MCHRGVTYMYVTFWQSAEIPVDYRRGFMVVFLVCTLCLNKQMSNVIK